MNKDQLMMALGKVVLSDDVKMGDAITATMQMSVFVALEGRIPKEMFLKMAEDIWDIGAKAMDKVQSEAILEA